MESINEATQLYVLAAELLGPRPRKVPPPAKPPRRDLQRAGAAPDRRLRERAGRGRERRSRRCPATATGGGGQPPLPTLYFCIPQNDKLLGYWDTVADRLYKIRHCMNIEGVVRQLALFEPPIDPGALVKAVAAGVDIGSALARPERAAAALPLHRPAPEGERGVQRRARRWAARCSPRSRRRTPRRWPAAPGSGDPPACRRSRPCGRSRSTRRRRTLDGAEEDAAWWSRPGTTTTEIDPEHFRRRAGSADEAGRARLKQQQDAQQLSVIAVGPRLPAQRHLRGVRLRRLARTSPPRSSGREHRSGAIQAAAGYHSLLGQRRHLRGQQGRHPWPATQRRSDDWKLQERLAEQGARPDRSADRAAAELRVDDRREGAREPARSRSRTPRPSTTSCARSTPTRSCTSGRSGRSRACTSRATSWPTTWRSGPSACFRFELGLRGQQLHQVRLLGQPEEGPAGG